MEYKNYRIISLFDIHLLRIIEMLEDVKKQGFNVIQISPLQPVKEEDSNEWWMLYQPTGFSIGNRKIGSKDDLKKLCDEAERRGIIIAADTIINHLAPEYGSDIRPFSLDDPELLCDPSAWKEFRSVSDWEDRKEVTSLCVGGLPGLNPDNMTVREKVIDMLNEYIDLGVRAFRFDAAKSIALPDEGCDFYPYVCSRLKMYLPIIYGEVLFADASLVDRYAKYMKVLTNYPGSNVDEVVRFEENKDSFLSPELGYTRDESTDLIGSRYLDLARKFPNTKYYARPGEEFNAFKSDIVRQANYQKVYKR